VDSSIIIIECEKSLVDLTKFDGLFFLHKVYKMPYSIRKVPNRKCYRVTNRKTKRVVAKCTSKEKARKQVRLLYGIENNRVFAKKVRARRITQRKMK
jgi:hypothetical protein